MSHAQTAQQWVTAEIPRSPTDADDCNGKALYISWNTYRKYYIAEFPWRGCVGRHVLESGSFSGCLDAAMKYYRRGKAGSRVFVTIENGDSDAISTISKYTELTTYDKGQHS